MLRDESQELRQENVKLRTQNDVERLTEGQPTNIDNRAENCPALPTEPRPPTQEQQDTFVPSSSGRNIEDEDSLHRLHRSECSRNSGRRKITPTSWW